MDRLVPPIDDLPGAGAMGLLDAVETMARAHPPFHLALLALLGGLPAATFAGLAGADQDKAISRFETAHPAVFNAALEVVYLAYYGDPRVHGADRLARRAPATGRLCPAAVRRGDPREATPAPTLLASRSGVSLGRLSGSQHLPRAAASPNKAVGDGRASAKALVSIITMVYHCFTIIKH